MSICKLVSAVLAAALFITSAAMSAVYEVGPGKKYASIGAAPLASLKAGDTVLIYYRSSPYLEKFVISAQGTASAPIVIRGVPDAQGNLPFIKGYDAKTAPGLKFWNENRGLVKIGGSSVPQDVVPRYITIENLRIGAAKPGASFTDSSGHRSTYLSNAAAILIEKGEHITIRNCRIFDNGNGIFISAGGATPTRDILIEGNYIFQNGRSGSALEHNVYSTAIGITFQYNRFGPLVSGSSGNNLKDRSAGLVVRYNWVEGGNRQLDLVDATNNTLISTDPSYRQTFVYGNVLIENAGPDNRQMVHYGGDSGIPSYYRKGVLLFYNNTLISRRPDFTAIFRLSTNEETCDARNNIFFTETADGKTLGILEATGRVMLSRNWMKPGWLRAFNSGGSVIDDGTTVTGTNPGFVSTSGQDYHLNSQSACIGAGALLDPRAIPAHSIDRQYKKHQSSEPRPVHDLLDIGGYEY